MPYNNYSERVLKIPIIEQRKTLELEKNKSLQSQTEINQSEIEIPEQNLLSCIGYTPVNLICITASIVLDSSHNGLVKLNMNFENNINTTKLNYNTYDINIFYFNNIGNISTQIDSNNREICNLTFYTNQYTDDYFPKLILIMKDTIIQHINSITLNDEYIADLLVKINISLKKVIIVFPPIIYIVNTGLITDYRNKICIYNKNYMSNLLDISQIKIYEKTISCNIQNLVSSTDFSIRTTNDCSTLASTPASTLASTPSGELDKLPKINKSIGNNKYIFKVIIIIFIILIILSILL